MSKKIILFAFVGLLMAFNVSAQINTKDYQLAEDYINNENFKGAIKVYKKILETDSLNSDINFKLGFCYLNTATEKEKAAQYLQIAVDNISEDKDKKKNNAPMEAFFYLGKAYHVIGEFEKAIEVYTQLKLRVEKQTNFVNAINKEIEACNNSIEFSNTPVKMDVNNLGEIINSEYSDHSPVFSADESVLIFTSRREGSTGGKMCADGQYFEDLYISYKDENGNWTAPQSMGANINTEGHEASIGLSVDGSTLFIYKSEDEGSIYVSTLEGDQWSVPKKLGENINTKSRETHASLSADGKSLYFTSARKGGFGGTDIYVSNKLPDGTWGPAQNLGKAVNTEFDEEGPYIHPDGVTLYFSSKGHKGMGGFDIFKVKKNEFGTWTRPENIGYPINTPADDVFFTPTAAGDRAYYASFKKEGFGESDLYLMHLPDASSSSVTVVTGLITVCAGKLPKVTITVTDSETAEITGIYKPNTKTGKYLFVLTRGGSYNVEYEANGEIAYSENIEIPDEGAFQEIQKTIKLKSGYPCDEIFLSTSEEANKTRPGAIFFNGEYFDEQLYIDNILFPFGKAGKVAQNESLDLLVEYLKKNPNAVVELGAYADAVGSSYGNQRLTQKRAQSIENYLTENGIPKKQLVKKGYGEENPIAKNKKADGSWDKDAQKYNRRIEFRIITQGKSKLFIRPNEVPDEYKDPKYKFKM